jgi:hypothetical protein
MTQFSSKAKNKGSAFSPQTGVRASFSLSSLLLVLVSLLVVLPL